MKKVLIANRGENIRAADVSTRRRACAAGDCYFAFPIVC